MINFSIVTVCLNSEDTIFHTIRSVQSQTLKNYEHILIDGGSNDATVSIIKNQNDNRIVFRSQVSKGIYGAMNEGINLAAGEIIGILNSDDFYANNKVLQSIKNAFDNANTYIVHGNIAFVNKNKHSKVVRFWQGSHHNNSSFKNGWHPPHPSFYMSKKGYLIVGYYREDMVVSADFDLMLRAFEVHKLKSVYIDECFVKMRMGGESTGSIVNILKGNINIAKSFRENNLKIGRFYFVNRFAQKILQYFGKFSKINLKK